MFALGLFRPQVSFAPGAALSVGMSDDSDSSSAGASFIEAFCALNPFMVAV